MGYTFSKKKKKERGVLGATFFPFKKFTAVCILGQHPSAKNAGHWVDQHRRSTARIVSKVGQPGLCPFVLNTEEMGGGLLLPLLRAVTRHQRHSQAKLWLCAPLQNPVCGSAGKEWVCFFTHLALILGKDLTAKNRETCFLASSILTQRHA